MCSGGAFHWTRNFPLVELTDVGTHLVPSKRGFHPMKLHRCAIACALAFASGNALSQTSSATTAVVADTLIQLYGHLDLSLDWATKGIKPGQTNAPFGTATPTGHLSWQPDISSNLSYVGIRGGRDISSGLRAVFQFETQIDLSATPGGSVSSSSSDSSVKGALASRNSYLGIAGGFGALKLGKTDAPYKLSTARMDPFSATVGDYNSIMGNTGGDKPAEVDTPLSHAMWYESPKFRGAPFSPLLAPGQKPARDNRHKANGETGFHRRGG